MRWRAVGKGRAVEHVKHQASFPLSWLGDDPNGQPAKLLSWFPNFSIGAWPDFTVLYDWMPVSAQEPLFRPPLARPCGRRGRSGLRDRQGAGASPHGQHRGQDGRGIATARGEFSGIRSRSLPPAARRRCTKIYCKLPCDGAGKACLVVLKSKFRHRLLAHPSDRVTNYLCELSKNDHQLY